MSGRTSAPMSFGEIAEVLGVTHQYVEQTVASGIRRLWNARIKEFIKERDLSPNQKAARAYYQNKRLRSVQET